MHQCKFLKMQIQYHKSRSFQSLWKEINMVAEWKTSTYVEGKYYTNCLVLQLKNELCNLILGTPNW